MQTKFYPGLCPNLISLTYGQKELKYYAQVIFEICFEMHVKFLQQRRLDFRMSVYFSSRELLLVKRTFVFQEI